MKVAARHGTNAQRQRPSGNQTMWIAGSSARVDQTIGANSHTGGELNEFNECRERTASSGSTYMTRKGR